MKFNSFIGLVLLSLMARTTFGQDLPTWKQATAAGYSYRFISGDPMHARFYTLSNGLTVILSENRKSPRIEVRIVVRTGSNNDPKDHTGLAHYLEHLLFKGTDKIGTLDWAREKPLLEKIDTLYEQYNRTTGEEARKAIYHIIDSVSVLASHYAIANEYNRLMSDIGSKGSNAFTSVEETQFEEDIPSNAVDKFLAVQSERFRNPVFRLFHTELEAVYEEKNTTLDNERWKIYSTILNYLFPTHNYGQQTTIGTIAHLKNPSLKAIKDYYHRYYLPNNIAIVMAGDFNPDLLVRKIDKAFAFMSPRPVKDYQGPVEKPLTAPIVREIYGPDAESVTLAFRTAAADSRDALVMDQASRILYNGTTGLMDQNLNGKQELGTSYATHSQYKDYGVLYLSATPKQGQTLEEAKNLLLEQVRNLQGGKFDAGLIQSISLNAKRSFLESLNNNVTRVAGLSNAFVQSRGLDWNRQVILRDRQSKLTRAEIMSVVQKYTGEGYVLIYKRKGEDKSTAKIGKPAISAVETNAGKQSAFAQRIYAMPVEPIAPVWMDFTHGITFSYAGITKILSVGNRDNDIFRLSYRFDMGSRNNKRFQMAAAYLQYLSTDIHSSEAIKKAFYDLACDYYFFPNEEETTVAISGLQQNFEKAMSLLEELFTRCQANEIALTELKNRMLKARADSKLSKNAIMDGLESYARYGPRNPFNSGLTEEEIKNTRSADLVNILHSLFGYRHTIQYYGPLPVDRLSAAMTSLHSLPAAFISYPDPVSFSFTRQEKPMVLFADYDMVQSEISWIRNGPDYDASLMPVVLVFNEYIGNGVGSVVWQTIRESKGLAYSTTAEYEAPGKKGEPFHASAYIGCQVDKMPEAIQAMNDLIDHPPYAEKGFERAKETIRKGIETDRENEDAIFYFYFTAIKLGGDHDIRKDEYAALGTMTLAGLQAFHNDQWAGKPFTYCILASEKKVDMGALEKIGEVKKLTLKEIFGY